MSLGFIYKNDKKIKKCKKTQNLIRNFIKHLIIYICIFFEFFRRTQMNIYVGNISYSTKEEDLREAFGEFGEVESVKIISDRETGRSKGFGFVEMTDDEAGEKAIEEMNGKEVGGRALRVNQARPKR
jgi:hypothetical protein